MEALEIFLSYQKGTEDFEVLPPRPWKHQRNFWSCILSRASEKKVNMLGWHPRKRESASQFCLETFHKQKLDLSGKSLTTDYLLNWKINWDLVFPMLLEKSVGGRVENILYFCILLTEFSILETRDRGSFLDWTRTLVILVQCDLHIFWHLWFSREVMANLWHS